MPALRGRIARLREHVERRGCPRGSGFEGPTVPSFEQISISEMRGATL
jgi:hypothetical protein